jgi:hypothetical protein
VAFQVFIVFFSAFLFGVIGSVEGYWNGLFSVFAFVLGSFTSILAGFIGMRIAVYSNSRTALQAMKGVGPGFVVRARFYFLIFFFFWGGRQMLSLEPAWCSFLATILCRGAPEGPSLFLDFFFFFFFFFCAQCFFFFFFFFCTLRPSHSTIFFFYFIIIILF